MRLVYRAKLYHFLKQHKNALTEAQSVLENYKDPQEKIIAEFLLEMLNVNPDPTILESYIEELNFRIILYVSFPKHIILHKYS